MIKKKSEQAKEVRQNMRGGPGQIEINHYFMREEISASCRLCARLELPPGSGIGLHEHKDEDEVFIIQQGKGVVVENGKETEVEAGDAILTGGGASHSIKNTGIKSLVVTAVIMQYKAP